MDESVINKMKFNHKGMDGKKHTVESKFLMSRSHKGRILSDEHRKKLRLSMIEYIRSNCNGCFIVNEGKNEKIFLDHLQSTISMTIHRSYEIDGYFLDGYIEELKMAIELDESAHLNISMISRHEYRQHFLENKYDIYFFRINENDWIDNSSKVIDDFLKIYNCMIQKRR